MGDELERVPCGEMLLNDLHQLSVRFGNSLFWHVCDAWFGLQLVTILVLCEEMPRYSLL